MQGLNFNKIDGKSNCKNSWAEVVIMVDQKNIH